MKRNVIAMLIAAAAVFAFACGGTAPNANNSNLNKNTAVLAPNANITPAVVPNVNIGIAPVNGNKTVAPTGVNTNRPGPPRPVDEKLRIMREDGKNAANARAPKDTVPPPATPKKP
jgi:hypothetical protein